MEMESLQTDLVSGVLDYVKQFFAQHIDPAYTYHNFDHTERVYQQVTKLAKQAGRSESEIMLVQIAALFHDTGFVQGAINHEEHSAKIAMEYLQSKNIDSQHIARISELIHLTKMGTETEDELANLLKDADMCGLGSKRFPEFTESLRKEKVATEGVKISKKLWDSINMDFLKTCKFQSKEGVEAYQAQKIENLDNLIKKTNKKEKKSKNKVGVTISENKSAQTQFKTALRNHIDLSNIADNKANIMISVNALILTLALPFLIDKSMDNDIFWIPTLLLGSVCLGSMIFATLATRPISMTGITTQADIDNRNTNLFFFGNYYKMEFEEYKKGIKDVVSDTKQLDDSIIKDLYSLGKSLGKKFGHLRLCYNIFMYGISATVVSFLVMFLRG